MIQRGDTLGRDTDLCVERLFTDESRMPILVFTVRYIVEGALFLAEREGLSSRISSPGQTSCSLLPGVRPRRKLCKSFALTTALLHSVAVVNRQKD